MQGALIATLVVGADIPPLRLSVLKTLLQPSLIDSYRCTDNDCLREDCLGNHVEVEGGNELGVGGTGVILHIIHHKNDRRGHWGDPLSITLPEGAFLRLMLVHIQQGRDMITSWQKTPELFVSNLGRVFSDSTFVHYWTSLMRTAAAFKIPRFPPSDGRTIFVEDFTSSQHPNKWEGAALIMGNTTQQWRASYMPSKKQRLVAAAVENHASFTGM